MNKKTRGRISSSLKKFKKLFSGNWVQAAVVGGAAISAAASVYTAGMTDILVVGGKMLLIYSGVTAAGNAANIMKDEVLKDIGYVEPDKNLKLLPPSKRKEVIVAEEVEDDED